METCADLNVGEDKGEMRGTFLVFITGYITFTSRCDSGFTVLLPSPISALSDTGGEARTYFAPHEF